MSKCFSDEIVELSPTSWWSLRPVFLRDEKFGGTTVAVPSLVEPFSERGIALAKKLPGFSPYYKRKTQLYKKKNVRREIEE
jgi:hypothetical protein